MVYNGVKVTLLIMNRLLYSPCCELISDYQVAFCAYQQSHTRDIPSFIPVQTWTCRKKHSQTLKCRLLNSRFIPGTIPFDSFLSSAGVTRNNQFFTGRQSMILWSPYEIYWDANLAAVLRCLLFHSLPLVENLASLWLYLTTLRLPHLKKIRSNSVTTIKRYLMLSWRLQESRTNATGLWSRKTAINNQSAHPSNLRSSIHPPLKVNLRRNLWVRDRGLTRH